MSIITRHCQRCGHNVDAHLSIYSGLGPPQRRCSKCGKRYDTGRQEWPAMSGAGQGWYIAYSCIAAVAVGGLAWIMAAACFGAGREGFGEIDLGKYRTAGVVWAVIWALVVLLFQAYRAPSSVRRFKTGQHAYEGPFWGLQTDLGLKVMVTLFASLVLVWLAGRVTRGGG